MVSAYRILFNYEWLTFAPNPRASQGGYDASRKAWKLHATVAEPTDTFDMLKGQRTLCGRVPAHGYDLDLFVEDKCERCVAVMKKIRHDRAIDHINGNTLDNRPENLRVVTLSENLPRKRRR